MECLCSRGKDQTDRVQQLSNKIEKIPCAHELRQVQPDLHNDRTQRYRVRENKLIQRWVKPSSIRADHERHRPTNHPLSSRPRNPIQRQRYNGKCSHNPGCCHKGRRVRDMDGDYSRSFGPIRVLYLYGDIGEMVRIESV